MQNKLQLLAFHFQKLRPIHRPHRTHHRAAGCAKRREIMSAQNSLKRLAHLFSLQRSPDIPCVACRKGIGRIALLNPIDIGLALCAVTGTEIRVCLHRFPDHDIPRQKPIDGLRHPFHGNRAVCEEVDHLSQGMNACIRASRGSQLDAIAEDGLQLLLQYILHGNHRRHLPLKAMVVRPIVGNNQTDIPFPRLHFRLVFRLHKAPPVTRSAIKVPAKQSIIPNAI